MPLRIDRFILVAGWAALVGCALVDGASQASGPGDPPATIGDPYSIDGVQYRPADVMNSDEVGYAGFTGTGNGVTAMHKTLPIPSYVEVTALANGRTVLVRVDARGPRANDRLIDLSCGAALQLGLTGMASAQVRVRRVNPPVQERGALDAGREAAERLPTPAPLLAALRKKLTPAPQSVSPGAAGNCGVPPATGAAVSVARIADTPLAPPASTRQVPPAVASKPSPAQKEAAQSEGGFIVEDGSPHRHGPAPTAAGRFAIQIAAAGDRAKATQLARRVGGHVEAAGKVYRVRLGPFADETRARAALNAIRAKGFADARMVTNGGR